eukprot:CAMPEP_0204919472 /NCGR_PEP_ID=MMETSP1397-20131031/16834_1 /ASSEMBLY_ACC=CAM_ASM_000891 /TAXON_ID=49980 /ORGANISM="Climacostomum Climacostomum virens, Strain Stock W-24" /LENGTH=824 /DNA_ID=CAMNT_0052093065 /DNA_START=638 /DNA_END=3112 /DNA_ORIENTATION=-
MDKPDNIRNMSVIAHVDHGKTTLTDSLIAKAGIISLAKAGDAKYTHTCKEEQDRGITIKSTGITMLFDYNLNGEGSQPFLFNLIDSPGHVDFSSEVTAALRVTDGALVVVDCVEGVCVQTETVLRQALQERIKPVLMINKVDRNLLELMLDSESMYQSFCRTIENVNVIISTYDDGVVGNLTIDPTIGNVAFGSGLMGWAFTLKRFADIYSTRFGVDSNKMMQRLWGDNFFDPVSLKWKKTANTEDGRVLPRAFCALVLEPIKKLASAVMEEETKKLDKLLAGLNIELNSEERAELSGKKLLKAIMQKWLSAADTLMEMMILHLPSPVQSQRYRTDCLYEGPLDDVVAEAMRRCDPNGPLMMFISKMVPSPDKGRFFAFGRVFSGTVRSQQKVRIMGPKYNPGGKEDLHIKNIQRTVLMMGRFTESILEVPAGNTCALVGIDQFLQKTGTITDHPEAHPIKGMHYSVSPVVRVAVKATNPAEIPKLVEGLAKLVKQDPLVVVETDDQTGEHIVAGSGELHVEVCLHNLEDLSGISITKSNPVVTYKETVLSASSEVVLAKTANKLNRLYMSAEPFAPRLAEAIEDEKISPRSEPKARTKTLVDDFGWDVNDAKKLWAFGPDTTGPNVIVDQTKGIQGIQDIQDSIIGGFQWATKQGPLCGESMRGVKFNLIDVNIHTDPAHRGGGQIIPAARRVILGSYLSATPAIQEPMFLVEITCPEDVVGSVYQVLGSRRGDIFSGEPQVNSPLFCIKAYLPVSESFGFSASLRSETSGKAFPQCVFHHWQVVNGSPLDASSQAHDIVMSVRERKQMPRELPTLEKFKDRL